MIFIVYLSIVLFVYHILCKKPKTVVNSWVSIRTAMIFIVVPAIVLAGKIQIFDYTRGKLLIATIIGILCAAAIWRILRQRSKTSKRWELLIVVLVIISSMLIASVISRIGELTLFRDLPTYFSIIMGALLAASEIRSRDFRLAVAAALAANAAGSLVLFFMWPDIASTNYSTLGLESAYSGRMTGPLLHPNAIGSLMCLGFIYAVVYLAGWKRILAGTLIFSVVILSDQRSALVACLASIVVLLFWKKKRSIYSWFGSTIVLLAGSTFFVIDGTNMINDLVNRRSESVSDRSDVLAFVVDNINGILPLGIGPNGLYDWTLISGFGFGFAHAHNSWLTMLVAGGLVSGGTFLVVSLVGVVRAARSIEPSDLAALSGVLVLSMVESPVFAGSNWSILPVAVLALYILFDSFGGSPVSAVPIKGKYSVQVRTN
ncbi:O-antigen ligase family protein [Arthrobacter alpinus]|uniref:O-antigen ligase family protein n=1 Tax=Arthrobacter alpinus TaxID=656366 RepID=UPI0009FA5864|nr:O-antigen ligase family protein [Arthrobacter alpinus]